MPVNKNERRYHDTSFLRGDARAVIDAEFEELKTNNQKSLISKNVIYSQK